MNAAEIMSSKPVTVRTDASVEDAARLMVDRRISALPVVDADGNLVGLVSEGDLMRRPESGTEPAHSWWLDLIANPKDVAAEYLKTHGQTAGDVMTKEVFSVGPETPVSDIAEQLERRHIKRAPVVKGGKVVGIVSRSDLLRMFAAHKDRFPEAVEPTDSEIREKILTLLRREGLPGEDRVNPVVVQGIVHLWGAVESKDQREAVRVAAKSVSGVLSVVNHIGILEPAARNVYWAE